MAMLMIVSPLGLQFLKDLLTISRIMNGDLQEFHNHLGKKVATHGTAHPWAKLQDIKDIKADLTAPPRQLDEDAQNGAHLVSDESSTDESVYELIEKEPTYPKKRGRIPNSARKLDQAYESRRQAKKARKCRSHVRSRIFHGD